MTDTCHPGGSPGLASEREVHDSATPTPSEGPTSASDCQFQRTSPVSRDTLMPPTSVVGPLRRAGTETVKEPNVTQRASSGS